jgi:hypothetical protein
LTTAFLSFITGKNMILPLLLQTFQGIYSPLLKAVGQKGNKDERIVILDRLVGAIEKRQPEAAADYIIESNNWSRTILEKHYSTGYRFFSNG